MRARDFSGIPMPVSEMRTTTSLSSESAVTSTRPPTGVYFTAFSTRLENIEVSCVSSPRTVYVAALPERFQERVMFLRRAVGRCRASTTIRMLLRSTGWGFWIPSSLSRRVRSNRSVISLASLSVSSRSCSAKKRAPSGSSSRTSTRLSASSFKLVAGVFNSWETFATKSRRILLTRFSSTTLTDPAPPEPASSAESISKEPFSLFCSSISLLARLHCRPIIDRPSVLALGTRLEAVAETPGGVHVLVVAVRERGPDAPDVDVDGARGTHARVPPHLLGKLLAALQLARLRGERHQELELLEPQVQGLALHADGEVFRVEPQVACLEDPAACTRRVGAPFEVGVDPRDQLLHAERLGNVVVGAGLEALDLVLLGVLGGDHHDHHFLVLVADLLADPDAGLAGEHHVEQDEVRPELAGELEGLAPARRLLHAETLPGEVVRQGVKDYRVVLDDQDLHRCLRSCSASKHIGSVASST